MGTKFSLLQSIPPAIADVTYPIGDKTLEMKIDQHVLTGEFLNKINEMDQQPGGGQGLTRELESMAFALSKLIISWNNSDSEPTQEYIAGLPYGIILGLFGAATDAFHQKKTTSETSEDTTSAAAA